MSVDNKTNYIYLLVCCFSKAKLLENFSEKGKTKSFCFLYRIVLIFKIMKDWHLTDSGKKENHTNYLFKREPIEFLLRSLQI